MSVICCVYAFYMSFIVQKKNNIIPNWKMKDLRINIKVYTLRSVLGIYKQEWRRVKTRILSL